MEIKNGVLVVLEDENVTKLGVVISDERYKKRGERWFNVLTSDDEKILVNETKMTPLVIVPNRIENPSGVNTHFSLARFKDILDPVLSDIIVLLFKKS
jgi:hypothetical protein